MRGSWCGLHDRLVGDLARYRHQTAWRGIATSHPVLATFGDPGGLLDAVHAPAGEGASSEARNDLLHALAAVAADRPGDTGPHSTADTALLVLILALWPGLDAVRGRLLRHHRDAPEELTAAMLEGITRSIRRVDLTCVTWIAATLVRNLERDLRRGLVKTWARNRVIEAFSDGLADTLATPQHGSVLGFAPAAGCADIDAARLVTRLSARIGTDAGLVVDVAVRGVSQQDAALARGLSPEAGRKRYQRALARLRVGLAA